jgi:hypothetical protein
VRRALLLSAWLCAACGPPSSEGFAVFELINAGEGEPLLRHLNFSQVARWTYAISDVKNDQFYAEDTFYSGTVTLENGVVANRYVTGLQVIYQEETEAGQYLWGSSDGDLFERPITQLSYPLRANREWKTGTVETPDLYRYRVERVETLETPAGTFVATRVLQLNTDTTELVTRWYVEDVGMVQRYGKNDKGDIVQTQLLRYQAPGDSGR